MSVKMNIKKCSTKELVEELRTREGVSEIIAEPYTKRTADVEGPAVILIIED